MDIFCSFKLILSLHNVSNVEFLLDDLLKNMHYVFTKLYYKAEVKDAINIECVFIGEIIDARHDVVPYLLTKINKAIDTLFEKDDIGNHGKIYNFKTCVLNEQEHFS